VAGVKEAAELEEGALIRAAQAGQMQAFTALVERHQERAIHLAYSFLGQWEDAREAAQDAFVKAYQNLAKFKGKSQFRTWLYRIVVNQCKDFLRKKKVRRHLAVVLREDEEEKESPENKIVSRSATDQNLLDQELENEIHRAMEDLPFRQKSVFALRYLEGLAYEEIAETLALTAGAVKAHLWQAGQKMKKRLESYLGAGGKL